MFFSVSSFIQKLIFKSMKMNHEINKKDEREMLFDDMHYQHIIISNRYDRRMLKEELLFKQHFGKKKCVLYMKKS